MRASLILCTKNGGERLFTCLAHVDALDAGADFDIVLVDNDSDDGVSWPALQDFGRSTRHACQVVRCARPGNSAGRNDGIAVARGDLLLFIDDDCYVRPDYVRAWQKIFADNHIGYGTGKILRHDPDPAISMIGCRETPVAEHLRPGQMVEPGYVQGSNMAFSRSCLDRVGLFDERFGSGVPFAGEDWDMALRASFAGFAGGYFPEPVVSHDHRRPIKDMMQLRAIFYEYGAGAVYAKHMRSRHFLTVGLRFVRQIKRLWFRNEHGRELLASLLKGWRDYHRFAELENVKLQRRRQLVDPE